MAIGGDGAQRAGRKKNSNVWVPIKEKQSSKPSTPSEYTEEQWKNDLAWMEFVSHQEKEANKADNANMRRGEDPQSGLRESWYSIYNWPVLNSSARTMDALYAGDYLSATAHFLNCFAEVYTFGYASSINLSVKATSQATKGVVQFGENVLSTTTRVGKNGNAVEVLFKNGGKMDINAARVKEWVPNLHPNAPAGTLNKVKFDNFLPGSKGFKRTPTSGEIDFLNGLFK
jgi:hypothetical protein